MTNISKNSTSNNSIPHKLNNIEKPTKNNTDKTPNNELVKTIITTSTPTNTTPKFATNEKRLEVSQVLLASIHYCKLTESMLDPFRKQFKLLTRTVDDVKSALLKKMDPNISTPANATSSDESLKNLTAHIASLEKKMDEQATKIAELHNDRLLLLQENKILKDQV